MLYQPQQTIELLALQRAQEITSIQATDALSLFEIELEYTKIKQDSQTKQKRDSASRKIIA